MMENIDHKYWAREVLRYLVKYIRGFKGGNKFIYYGELAKAIGYPEPHHGNVFAQRIGNTLGVMGHLIENIVIDGEQPPYIQALLVNINSKLPGPGIKEFYKEYSNLPNDKKRDLIDAEYQRIFEFGSRWEKLLKELDIPLDDSLLATENRGSSFHNPYGSEGSPEHKALRNYIYEHPQELALIPIKKYREYPLKSGDFIDVFFETNEKIVAVEVKSRRSGHDDMARGIYQCVKYKAVLSAENIIKNNAKPVESILVLETNLPRYLLRISNKLDVLIKGNILPQKA